MVGVLKEALKFVVVVVAAVVVVVAALQSVPLTFPMDIKKKIFNRKIYLDKKLSKNFFKKVLLLKYCIYLVRRIIVGHLISNRSNRWLWSILLRGTSLCFLLHILT